MTPPFLMDECTAFEFLHDGAMQHIVTSSAACSQAIHHANEATHIILFWTGYHWSDSADSFLTILDFLKVSEWPTLLVLKVDTYLPPSSEDPVRAFRTRLPACQDLDCPSTFLPHIFATNLRRLTVVVSSETDLRLLDEQLRQREMFSLREFLCPARLISHVKAPHLRALHCQVWDDEDIRTLLKSLAKRRNPLLKNLTLIVLGQDIQLDEIVDAVATMDKSRALKVPCGPPHLATYHPLDSPEESMASEASSLVRHKDTVEDVHIAWRRDWLPDDDEHQATSSPDDDEHQATEVSQLPMSSSIHTFFCYDWCFLKAFLVDRFRPDSNVKFTQMVALTDLWASIPSTQSIGPPLGGEIKPRRLYTSKTSSRLIGDLWSSYR